MNASELNDRIASIQSGQQQVTDLLDAYESTPCWRFFKRHRLLDQATRWHNYNGHRLRALHRTMAETSEGAA